MMGEKMLAVLRIVWRFEPIEKSVSQFVECRPIHEGSFSNPSHGGQTWLS